MKQAYKHLYAQREVKHADTPNVHGYAQLLNGRAGATDVMRMRNPTVLTLVCMITFRVFLAHTNRMMDSVFRKYNPVLYLKLLGLSPEKDNSSKAQKS